MTQPEKKELAECWQCVQGWTPWTKLAKRKGMSYIGMKLRFVSLLTKEYKNNNDE